MAASQDKEYNVMCGNGCGTRLCINTPIMCYTNMDGLYELTLCNPCYWDAKYWKDDGNPDNEDEIKDYMGEEAYKNVGMCVDCGRVDLRNVALCEYQSGDKACQDCYKEDEDTEDEVEVTEIEFKGSTYWVGEDNTVYGGEETDPQVVGTWNANEKRVIFH